MLKKLDSFWASVYIGLDRKLQKSSQDLVKLNTVRKWASFWPLRPQPSLIHSGSMKLIRMLMHLSWVGKTLEPPHTCSSENWSCKSISDHTVYRENFTPVLFSPFSPLVWGQIQNKANWILHKKLYEIGERVNSWMGESVSDLCWRKIRLGKFKAAYSNNRY